MEAIRTSYSKPPVWFNRLVCGAAILLIVLLLYTIIVSIAFAKKMEVVVKFSVTEAWTMTYRGDDGTTVHQQRKVKVRGDFAAVGAPERREWDTLDVFERLANKSPQNVIVGDKFGCTVTWIAASDFPFTLAPRNYPDLDPSSCRLLPRTKT